ncbi:DUF2125 domain-containing protein [Gemmobacter denitrificans]|uniref:DUF2125 domain-containing protein n=1 Tax=Gemmobacter denitrificans TaxID=3123040 RepID=A0ABU8BVU0_9RHOB
MRGLIWVVMILAALYGGYWFVGARAAESGAERALVEAAARGIVVDHQGLSVAGFPSRFDLTLTQPRVAAGAVGWQAEFAQVFALSYSPWKLIAALPNDQHLTLPGQTIGVQSTRMQASLFLTPSPALPLSDFKFVTEGLNLRSDAGWALAAGSVNVSLVTGEGATAQLALRGLDLVPDQALIAAMGGSLPAVIERLDLLADLELAAPLALRGDRPEVRAIDLREAHLLWGPVQATISGRVVADDLGQAEGELRLKVAGWEAGLAAAEQMGLVPEQFRVALRSVLQGLAAQSTEPGTLDLPLVMQGGRMMLGPLPLGAAPLLR